MSKQTLRRHNADLLLIVLTAIGVTAAFLASVDYTPLMSAVNNSLASVSNFLETKVFVYSLIKEIALPIALLAFLFFSVFFFGYLVYRITKSFDKRFALVFFSEKILSCPLSSFWKNKKIFLKRLILLTLGYSLISLMLVNSLFTVFPNVPQFQILSRSVPLYVFFSLGILFAIRLLNKYSPEIAKNLFYTVLFGFLSTSIYLIAIKPGEFITKIIDSSTDIVILSIIFIVISDTIMDCYLKAKSIKKSLINR